jgi:hypothetical protein
MTTETKPVAKSLHTITVLVQVARLIGRHEPEFTPQGCVNAAMRELGLANRPDPYGLADRALAILITQA